MSQDDIDVGQQASFANQLSNSLADANSRMNVFADASRSQAKFAIDIADSFLKTSEHLDSIANSTEKINDCLGNFLSGVKSLSSTSGMNEFFKNFVKHIDNTTDRYKKTAQAQEELAEAAEKAQTSSEKNGSCDGPPFQTTVLESIRLENPVISLLALVFSPKIAIFH